MKVNFSHFRDPAHPVVVAVPGEAAVVNGRRGVAPLVFSSVLNVVVAPMPGEQVAALSQGEMASEGITLYSPSEILPSHQGPSPVDGAIVQYRGKTFRVVGESPWPTAGFVVNALRAASFATEGSVLFGVAAHGTAVSVLAKALSRALAPSRAVACTITVTTGLRAFVGLSHKLSQPVDTVLFRIDGALVDPVGDPQSLTIAGDVIDVFELDLSVGTHTVEVV